MKFLCGCDQDDPYVKNYHPHIVTGPMGEHQLTSKHYNEAGQEICPIHGKPLNIDNIKKRGPQGNEVTDFAAESRARYGPVPRGGTLGSNGISDRRDNRDPATVGRATLIERAHERANGKDEIPASNGKAASHEC